MSTGRTVTRQKSLRSSKALLWIAILIILFIVDAVCAYFLHFWGNSALLMRVSFFILPLVILIFCFALFINGYARLLLRVGIVLLCIVNVLFGYNVYDQERYGFGLEFIGVIPFLFALMINDLILLVAWKEWT